VRREWVALDALYWCDSTAQFGLLRRIACSWSLVATKLPTMTDREGRLAADEVYYRAWDAAGTPRANALLSHGYAEHSGRYDHVARHLNAAGIAVWALDHRGHGQSAGDRGDIVSFDSTVADLDALMDLVAAEGAGRPTFLVGHSLGGAIAIAYALAHADRLTGLSLSAPAIVIAPEMLALADLPEIPPLPLADGVSSDPDVVQNYKDDPLNYLGAPPRNLLLVMGSVGEQVARLGELTLPVQIMQGSSDLLISPQALKDVVAGVSSTDLVARLWPGLFHEIFNEPTKDAVLDALVAWMVERAG
jgi:acylglycerol lipase